MIKPANAIPSSPSRGWRANLPALAIFLLVAAAYLPALRGEFIWDDDYNILKSLPLRSLDGLRRIWLEPGATQQYYPLTHSSFWLDYHLWGLHPSAYHLENLLLHALSAVLVWRLLCRLGATGAWLGAALFALHPVAVESVAWITERKNALSGVFFLASLLAAVEFWLPRRIMPISDADHKTAQPQIVFGHWRFYWLALFLYLCALWSKTATVGLPGVILLLAWWKRGRLVWRDFILLLPFLAFALWLGLITMAIEKNLMRVVAGADDWRLSALERFFIAGRASWFYLGKIFWPHPLMFMYPRWKLLASPAAGYGSLAAWAALLVLLWRKRAGWGRPALAALGYFVIMLFPLLGFFDVFFFRYSFVCDHFQYLAAIGPLALAAAAITAALGVFGREKPLLRPAICGILLLALGALTWRQTGIYRNLESLWRDTLVHNPDSWMAHDNLGIYLSRAGHFGEAESHYRAAIALRPQDYIAYYDLGLDAAIKGQLKEGAEFFHHALEIFPGYGPAHYDLGNVLARQENLDDAIREYEQALQTHPALALAHYNLANAFAKQGKLDEAISEYAKTMQLDPTFAPAPFSLGNALARKGDLESAAEAYAQALQIKPDYAAAHVSLGRILAGKGKVDEAIEHYRTALAVEPNSVDALANLGNARVSQGRLEDAVEYYRAALRLNPDSSIIHFDLGVALSRLGRQADAKAEFGEAKRLNLAR